MTFRCLFRYLWALPCTVIGLALGLTLGLCGASASRRSGVLEVAFTNPANPVARALAWLPFTAITFGHVVLAITHGHHDALRVHERAHVAQYERWGPVFLLAYPLSSLAQILRGRRAYVDNWFEVQARSAECADDRRAPRGDS